MAVTVATQDAPGRAGIVEQRDGVEVVRFPWRGVSASLAVSPMLGRWLRANVHTFAIVHAHSYHATPALLAALCRPQRLLFTPHYHGTGHSRLRALLHLPYRVIGRLILNRAERVICVSQVEAKLVRKHFPVADARIEVIPNGVDAERIRGARPFALDRPIVLAVSRLERYKQVHRLIEAASHLESGARVIVIGDGAERGQLERLVQRRGLGDRVSLLGSVDDDALARWYRTSRVVVSLSEREAYGLVCVEALAAGARVIASDIPAHASVAQHLIPGGTTLVPTGIDPAALARLIDATLGLDRLDRDRAELPTWAGVGARTLALYGARR